ncbi:basic proline-rich protein-like [Eumetopias jubatus]|uniref:basic proline-rich protein-like n=1 Tax=Eumetopias jubatus TaxID=34886 RepID=UPI001015CD0D|nr:basic proline-rich protein-like [Eumetopias jubatus]
MNPQSRISTATVSHAPPPPRLCNKSASGPGAGAAASTPASRSAGRLAIPRRGRKGALLPADGSQEALPGRSKFGRRGPAPPLARPAGSRGLPGPRALPVGPQDPAPPHRSGNAGPAPPPSPEPTGTGLKPWPSRDLGGVPGRELQFPGPRDPEAGGFAGGAGSGASWGARGLGRSSGRPPRRLRGARDRGGRLGAPAARPTRARGPPPPVPAPGRVSAPTPPPPAPAPTATPPPRPRARPRSPSPASTRPPLDPRPSPLHPPRPDPPPRLDLRLDSTPSPVSTPGPARRARPAAAPGRASGLTAPVSPRPPPGPAQPHHGPHRPAAAVGRAARGPGLSPPPAARRPAPGSRPAASPSAAAARLLLRARRWFRSHKMAALTAATSVPAAAGNAGERGGPACGPVRSPPQRARADSGLGAGARGPGLRPALGRAPPAAARAHPLALFGTESACACAALLPDRALLGPPARFADAETEAAVDSVARGRRRQGAREGACPLPGQAVAARPGRSRRTSGPRSLSPGASPRCGNRGPSTGVTHAAPCAPEEPTRGSRLPSSSTGRTGAQPGRGQRYPPGSPRAQILANWKEEPPPPGKPPWPDQKGDADSRGPSPRCPAEGLGCGLHVGPYSGLLPTPGPPPFCRLRLPPPTFVLL